MKDNFVSDFEPTGFKWSTSAMKVCLIMLKRNKISYIPPLSARDCTKHDM